MFNGKETQFTLYYFKVKFLQVTTTDYNLQLLLYMCANR